MLRSLGEWVSSMLAVAAAVMFPAGAATAGSTPEPVSFLPDDEAERAVERLVDADRAVGLGRIHRLDELGPYLERPAYLELLESAGERAEDPLVAFRLRRRAASVRRDLGPPRSADDALEGQGCLTDWSVVGPFDNDSMRGFESRLAPERGEPGPYEGKTTGVDWRTLPEFDRGCLFRLGRTVQPSTSAVAYLSGRLRADSAGEARLMVGAQGAYKVWLNGELVAHQRENLGLYVDSRAWRVDLEEGDNELLVKVGSRSNESIGFVARVVGPELNPLDSVESVGAPPREAVPGAETGRKSDGAEPVAPTGQGALARARACASERSGTAASWCVGVWRRAESGRAATPWRDAAQSLAESALSRDGGGEAGLSARDLARLAKHHDDPSTRTKILKEARELAPDDPWIGLRLAEVYRSSIERLQHRASRALLEEILERQPEFWPVELELADRYSGEGFGRRALELVRGIDVENRLQRPALLRELVYLESNFGRRRPARNLRRQLGEISASTGSWVRQRYEDLTTKGDQRKALELVRDRLERYPLSRRWGLREIELLRSLGRSKEALVGVGEMIERVPGDTALRRRKAALLVAGGQTREAVSVMEEAVEIDPQNGRLEDYLSSLQADEEGFHEPWMTEDVRARARAHPPQSYAQDTVLEQTIVRVASNGLSQRVVQRVDRAITSEGVEGARNHSVSYTRGEDRVEVIDVKVHRADGTVLEDYDQWRTGRSKKSGPYYNDQRQLRIRANNVEAGDLVEYRYRVRGVANENFRGDYFGDLTYVQGARPTGYLRYVVQAPEDLELHFRAPEFAHEEVGSDLPEGAEPPEGEKVRGFELEEIPAVETDPRQPGHADVYDYVLVSNKETWDEVGRWWWNLIEEQLIVNEEIAQTVDEITEGLDEERAKVEAIHNHIVENTRYLHVGLGIHGWKPYRTTECYRNQYGDCKDKSSLLKVMLREAGIDSHLVLVRTRDLGAVSDGPPNMHVFNHAITYVPSLDLYLDPTAEFNGTRQLPPMDQGAQGLIVRDGGATEWTRLPVDSAGDNLLVRELDVDLSRDPTVTSGRMVARGQNAVYYRRNLENPERRDEKLEKQLAELYPGADLVSAEYDHLENLEKPVEIRFTFEGGRLERTSNGRAFVFPYGTEKNLRSRFADQAERDRDLEIRVPFRNETEMRFRLSGERGFARLPESVRVDSDFGEVEIEYSKAGGTLTAAIRYSIDVQRVPVEEYAEFRAFLSRATSALNETIGLTDETAQ